MILENNIYQELVIKIKTILKDAEGGHDWFHVERVYKNSMMIAETINCNLLVVQLGALLHDIADAKFYDGDETVGPLKARMLMECVGIDKVVIEEVVFIIENISFRGGSFSLSNLPVELAIVQDADRLDAIGAIGIARAFNYGGYKNRALYNPEILPQLNMDKVTYKKSTAPTINHFYEKLLLLKDKMNTEKGRAMAEERHLFMEDFLKQFYKEWY